ncbi:MASE3 domain-containing protein [Geobacter sp.]|uniref:MASE3 domain-containing protein n=1 Tax=Geobacter sp. TaxID=46610 RepID=UPI0027BA84A5|nr:MASE3 domain-containing protein [Geobacter sp.]
MTDKTTISWPVVAVTTGMLAGLWVTSRLNFLLFHALVEMFSVLVSGGIFVIAWNSRRFPTSPYLLFIGIAHLCVGGIDLLHTLAYKGMGVFPGNDANLPTQLWIAARYLQSISLLVAPLCIGRRLWPRATLAAYLAVTAALVASIFGGIFPPCFVEGVGLTPCKIVSEYLISLTLVAALLLLRKKRAAFDGRIVNLLSTAIALMVVAELAFTFYVDVYGLSNLVGHLFKVAAVFLIYKGTVETSLTRPYELLFRELTESEKALRESHQRISSIMESITDAFFALDHGWNFTYVNEEAERLLNRRRDELIGRNVWTMFPEAVGSTFHEQYHRAVSEKKSVSFEEYYPPLGRWFDVRAYPAGDGLSVFFRDITGRMKIENTLRQSEEKFAKAFQTAPTIMIITTLSDGRYLEVNEAFEKTVGWRREEVLGRTSREMGIWVDQDQRNEVVRTTEAGEKVINWEIILRGKSGETIEGLYSAVGIELNDEKCLLSIVRDVTARRRAEREVEILNAELTERARELEEINCELEATVEQLESVNRELEAANRELESFSYTVSHDLRGPLTNINSLAQVVLELYGPGFEPKCREFMDDIHHETLRMDELIGTLLDFARIARSDLRPETVDLSAMARAVAAACRLKEPERLVTFVVADGITAHGDSRLLRVALDNLLGNAWKYTGTREEARIEFGVTKHEGRPAYFVRDNGVGFDMADVDRLFAPFARLDSGAPFRGEGIGLATVARIIQRHNGRIWAEGEKGKGATFFFSL